MERQLSILVIFEVSAIKVLSRITCNRISAESWWVNSLIRNPILIPYTLGNKRLDRLYLDSTFAVTSNIYREFPSKAEGLAELFRKIERYPDDTIFYFRAWTFGYEDVWIALSAALNTNVSWYDSLRYSGV